MSSEVFENRQDDFQSLYVKLKTKVDDKLPRSLGEEKKRVIREIERDIENATILIQEMEAELRNAPSAYRINMSSKVRGFTRDIERISRTVKHSSSAGRENFGMDTRDDLAIMASSQRGDLLRGSDILGRTTDSIARSHRIAAETDQIGEDIIDELGTQRESLVRTKVRLTDTDSNLSQSRKVLNKMARRVMTNKLILMFVIILELAILGGLIYWKFFS